MQTDRTVRKNIPDIIICDNEKRTYMTIDVTVSADRDVIKREAEKILKCKALQYKYSTFGTQNKSDTSNNRGNWNHLKITQKVPEQHIGKALRDIKELLKTATPGTAHTHTAGSTDVKYTTFNMGNSITCAIYCNNRIAATVHSVGTWFVCGV